MTSWARGYWHPCNAAACCLTLGNWQRADSDRRLGWLRCFSACVNNAALARRALASRSARTAWDGLPPARGFPASMVAPLRPRGPVPPPCRCLHVLAVVMLPLLNVPGAFPCPGHRSGGAIEQRRHTVGT